MSWFETELSQQKAANQSALPYVDLYQEHRQRLTHRLVRGDDPALRSQRLCVLGAGNCADIELPKLCESYAEIHLVDLDREALERARDALPKTNRERVRLHGGVDLTGMLDKLARWKLMQITPEELMAHPAQTAETIGQSVDGPFDVVASTCVITQMQLSVLNALTDRHQLFQAVRHTVSVTHLRTLSRLTCEGGRCLFVTDLVSTERLKAGGDLAAESPRQLYERALREGNVIYVAHPKLIESVVRDDPALRRELSLGDDREVWLWQQGPNRSFVVYAAEMRRN
jgi:hypothetical protein